MVTGAGGVAYSKEIERGAENKIPGTGKEARESGHGNWNAMLDHGGL